MKTFRIESIVFSCFLLASPAPAGNEAEQFRIECRKSASFLAPLDAPDYRKYAPDREVQVIHLALDVTPDFKDRTISGEAMLRLKVVNRPAREVRLDAVDLRVRSITATRKIQAWQSTEDNIIVTFEEPVAVGEEVSLTIRYSAEPTQGLYFRTREMGYKEGDDHLFSQGEEAQGRHWYPCLDAPNQMFTSEIICRVPEGMTAISNGRLVSQEKDPATGLLAIHWSQEKRHANYLITLVAGYFKKLEDNCHGIPLAFYTPPSEIEYALTSFKDTKDMIAFFEKETGVPYPWVKYDQVCVNDFVAGGMENTSATTLTDGTLFTEASENILTSEGLVAHELAHQWFGDLVTCKDWSHVWLNEGFATYYETLWNEQHNGRDNMLYELYHRTREIVGIPKDENAIVRRSFEHPDEMFSYLAYPKGSWVLHMLRAQLGDDLYRKCIKTYLDRHTHGNVVTDDLRAVIEEFSGRSFDQFFEQWLYHGRQPELEIAYSWDETAKLAKVSVRQTHEVNANVLLFNFPLVMRFKDAFGTVDRTVQVAKRQEDFYFSLDGPPNLVRVDPDYTLLAKIKFNVPAHMLEAQLANKEDVVGRLLAIEQLGSKRESVSKLKAVLNNDLFYGVRLEAANALRSLHTEEALAALLESTNQTDARVRRQVTENIGGFYNEKACRFGLQVLSQEKNPEIVCTALRDLGAYPDPAIRDALLRNLNSNSFRNQVADAAISAIRSQDDPSFVSPLLDALKEHQAAFTSHGFAQGLDALAYLGRNEEKKDSIRLFLVAQTNSRKRSVQVAAIRSLGALGDTKALAVLEKFAAAAKDSPQRSAAEKSLASLRAARRPVDDFKNLRQEVLDLQKANRELKQDLVDLKKQVEAKPAAAPLTRDTSKPKASPPKISAPKAGSAFAPLRSSSPGQPAEKKLALRPASNPSCVL